MDYYELEDSKLHEAVRYGDVEDVRLALKEGDDPNQIGIYQWNPLHEASSNGDQDIVKLLLKYNGNPNKADLLQGSTPVHYASSNGHASVLKLLLDAGGLYSIQNKNGETSLDLAKEWDCEKLIREQRDKQLILPLKRTELKEDISDYNASKNNNNEAVRSDTTSLDSIVSELDTISIDTASSSSSRSHSRCWGPERVLGMKQLQLGHIQLSFEYNLKKKTFKIRVWQVTDILLPPKETSMISSVYVKSLLQPDKGRETKRKTEEVKTEDIDYKEIKKKGQEHIVNFQPACFKFKKPLEYENVTREIVESKFVDIEVCVVQRYTRRSFVIATWNMPLKVTVKKLVKEKFPLKPALSTKLPENMKVYAASEMDLTFSRNLYHSNPNLRRSTSSRSSSSWATPYDEQRAQSDTDLHKVTVDLLSHKKTSSIEINLAEEEDDFLQQSLQQIKIMDEKETRKKQLEFTSLNMPNYQQQYDDNSPDIEIHDPVRITEVQIHVPKPDLHSLSPTAVTKKKPSFLKSKAKAELKEKANRPLKAGPKFTDIMDEEARIGMSSRPETPSWDYYESPFSFDNKFEDPGVFDETSLKSGEVILPAATSFDKKHSHKDSRASAKTSRKK